ncbi:hypothetical protein CDV31_014887 [Fusarium ambrosium]|uniref:Uncharacterized protein n=1 Tax=Fusarium ambrosium TaxID=131363 RepID=A0A428STB7_9HYPO|nr:hypothetical protein CDV31_014887 [Fusarium ambrosium]
MIAITLDPQRTSTNHAQRQIGILIYRLTNYQRHSSGLPPHLGKKYYSVHKIVPHSRAHNHLSSGAHHQLCSRAHHQPSSGAHHDYARERITNYARERTTNRARERITNYPQERITNCPQERITNYVQASSNCGRVSRRVKGSRSVEW